MTHFHAPHGQRQGVNYQNSHHQDSHFAPVSPLSLQHTAVCPESIAVPPHIQPKLTIGSAGDRYEQEADRMAAEVVQQINTAQPSAHKPQLSQISSPAPLQRKQAGAIAASSRMETAIGQVGSGQALPAAIRHPMERAFGADFSGVKIHTDAASDQMNRAIGSYAFTNRQNIFFRRGELNPTHAKGQELIAHELAHVVQQGSLTQSNLIQPKFGLEVELGLSLRQLQMNGSFDEPSYIKQPIVAKTDKGYAVHADHAGDRPIVELVNDPPIDEFVDSEETARGKLNNIKQFAVTAQAKTANFTQPALLQQVIPGATIAHPTIFVGSHTKIAGTENVDGKVQATYGIRLDRIPFLFGLQGRSEDPSPEPIVALPEVNEGEDAPPPPPPAPKLESKDADVVFQVLQEAQKNAKAIVDQLHQDYKPSLKTVTRRFAAPSDRAKLDSLEGFFGLISNYLIAGRTENLGSKWVKNYVGQLFYKSKLSSVRKELSGFDREILEKRYEKVKSLLMQQNGRVASEHLMKVYQEKTYSAEKKRLIREGKIAEADALDKNEFGLKLAVGKWLDRILSGKGDPLFRGLKNEYGKEIKPDEVGPEIVQHRRFRRDSVKRAKGVVMENRKIGRLISGGSKPEDWVTIGMKLYRALRKINGSDAPDASEIDKILKG